jgi:hypothetical protein
MSKRCRHSRFQYWRHFVYTTLLLTPYSLLITPYSLLLTHSVTITVVLFTQACTSLDRGICGLARKVDRSHQSPPQDQISVQHLDVG